MQMGEVFLELVAGDGYCLFRELRARVFPPLKFWLAALYVTVVENGD